MSLIKGIKEELQTLRHLIRKRIYISPKNEQDVVREFHKLYYDSNLFGKTFVDTFWLGVGTLKCPLDLWIYQEIIHRTKPDVIIETGTAGGGSALFLASIFDLVGKGEVVSIDIEKNEKRPSHNRITYLLGSSVSDEIVDRVKGIVAGKGCVMVILDSDHSKAHVLKELDAYHRFVTKGSYLIVEDTNVNGHPVLPEHGPGPMEALDDFLSKNHDFVIDEECEKFYLTMNPRGHLRKIN